MSMPLSWQGHRGDLGDPRSLIGTPTGRAAYAGPLPLEDLGRRAAQNERSARKLGWGITEAGRRARYHRGPGDLQLVQDVAVFQGDRGLTADGVIGPATLDEMRRSLFEWRAAGQPRGSYGAWIARYLRVPGGLVGAGLDSRTLQLLENPSGPRILSLTSDEPALNPGFSTGQAGATEDAGGEKAEGLSTGAKVAIGAGGLAALAAAFWLLRRRR